MAKTRPYALNTGSTISGTTQIGSLAIGVAAQDYSTNPGGVTWYMGPDEELGYVIAVPNESEGKPQFWRSSALTNESYISIGHTVGRRRGKLWPFADTQDFSSWCTQSGYSSTFAYEAETISLLSRMDVRPTNGLKDLINKTIKDLKSEGIWDKDDCRYFFNLHTQQASNLNWKSTGYTITAVNSPVWTAYSGYTGSTGKYIKNGYNFHVVYTGSGINFAQNDGGIGTSVIGTSNGSSVEMGATQSIIVDVSRCVEITARYGPNLYANVNSRNSDQFVKANSGSTGTYDAVRTASNSMTFYKDGSYFGTKAVSSTEPPDLECYFLCGNNYGNPNYYSTNTLNYGRIGGSLTSAQIMRNKEIVEYFNTNIMNLEYDPDARALFARMEIPPSTGLKNLISKTIHDLKATGLWYRDDCRYQFNLHTQQASNLNWKSTGNTVTVVNSPIWTPFVGYSGATGSYINPNFNLQNGTNYKQNNATIGIWQIENFDTGSWLTIFQAWDTFSGWTGMYLDKLGSNMYPGINMWGSGSPNVTSLGTVGLHTIKRDNSVNYQYYYNDGSAITKVYSSAPPINYSPYILAGMRNGSAWGTGGNKAVNNFFAGGAYTDADVITNYKITKYFNDNIGVLGSEIIDQSQWNQTGLTWWSVVYSGWTANGTAVVSDGTNAGAYLYKTGLLTSGKLYKWDISVVITSGSMNLYTGGWPNYINLRTGTYNHYQFTYNANASYPILYSMNCVCTVTYLSIKEVL